MVPCGLLFKKGGTALAAPFLHSGVEGLIDILQPLGESHMSARFAGKIDAHGGNGAECLTVRFAVWKIRTPRRRLLLCSNNNLERFGVVQQSRRVGSRVSKLTRDHWQQTITALNSLLRSRPIRLTALHTKRVGFTPIRWASDCIQTRIGTTLQSSQSLSPRFNREVW